MQKQNEKEVAAFKERPSAARYVYLVTKFIALKWDTVAKEAVYIVVGIREDGSKEVLVYAIFPTNPTTVWKELLKDIKNRGVTHKGRVADRTEGCEDFEMGYWTSS